MDYDLLKAFIELFHYPICDVSLGESYLVFSVKTALFDLSAVDTFNALRLEFPDRKAFVYYPDINITTENNCRVIRIWYDIDKVEEFVSLRNLEI